MINDTFNRQEAIDILTRMSTDHFYGHRTMEAFRLGAEALSAERHGRWNELPYSYECSVCGIIRAKGRTGKWNYCPNCGAKMDIKQWR